MNVVLVILDTLRRDFLGCYGNTWIETPHIDRFAEMGVVFENAYLGSSPCMPARREMWTGSYEWPWRGWGPLEHDDANFVRSARAAGAKTMLITDHYHLFEHGAGNYHFDFDGWSFIRGQENDKLALNNGATVRWPAEAQTKLHRRWEQYYLNTLSCRTDEGSWRREQDAFAARTFKEAVDWIDDNRSVNPFLLVVDCFDPHEPFDPPPGYDALYSASTPTHRVPWPIYGSSDRYTDAELEDIKALYAGEVTLVDRWFGFFLDKLERLGRLKDTAIILTTDHGYLFGEHGMIGKPSAYHGDSNMYQGMAHVPLLLYHPEMAGRMGHRSRELVQPVDLYDTVLSAFRPKRAEPDRPDTPQHGGNLFNVAEDGQKLRDVAVYAKFGEAVNVTDGRYTLFQWPVSEAPLNWYSSQPPQFLKPQCMEAYDRDRQRFSVTYARGEMSEALYDVERDYGQRVNLWDREPQVVARLRGQLRAFMESIAAPKELYERFNL